MKEFLIVNANTNQILGNENDLLIGQTIFSENVLFLFELVREFSVTHFDFLACNTLKYDIWNKFYDLLFINIFITICKTNFCVIYVYTIYDVFIYVCKNYFCVIMIVFITICVKLIVYGIKKVKVELAPGLNTNA